MALKLFLLLVRRITAFAVKNIFFKFRFCVVLIQHTWGKGIKITAKFIVDLSCERFSLTHWSCAEPVPGTLEFTLARQLIY